MTDTDTPQVDFAAMAKLAEDAVGRAAFWAALADAVKIVAEAARTEAVKVCGAQRREATTATTPAGVKVGKLSHSPDTWSWLIADGAELLRYFEKTYPDWIEVVPERTYTIPEERRLNEAKVQQWLAGLTDEGVDAETGRDCTDLIRKGEKPGRWTLTKDKAAKARVLEALKAMEVAGIRLPEEVRTMIEGGR
jgi:hypothetical protein